MSVAQVQVAEDEVPLVAPERLTQVAFMVLLALMVARATMVELVRDPFQVSPGQAYTPLGTGPGATVVLNMLCLLPAALVLVRRVVSGEYAMGRSWGALVWVGMGLLAVGSGAWASDAFSAVVTGSTLVAAGAMAWAGAQLVRSWARFRVVLAVCVGLLAVYVAQGLYYRFAELPMLQEQVERSKDRILRERGFTPGTFAAEQFMRRISGGEMIGFGSSPNTYAAMLVLLGVVSGGLLVQGMRDRRDAMLLLVTGAAIGLGVWVLSYTRSTTAWATPVMAAGVVAVGWRLRGVIAERRRTFFVLGVGLFVGAMAAVVAHGLYHGTLPGASLNFRWRYWVGSWSLFREHMGWGVGYANFGPFYLAHRLPAAAEEIKDPHNLFARFGTELGVVGLVLCGVWLLWSGWEATQAATAPRRRGLTIGPMGLAGVVALATALNVVLTIDWTAGSDWVVLELFKRLMFAGVLVVAAALSVVVSTTDARGEDAPAELALLATGAGLLVFLVHNLIDFSFFENGAMAVAAVLLGSVVGVRGVAGTGGNAGKAGRVVAGVWLGVIGVSLVAFTAVVVNPALRGETLARRGDESMRTAVRPDREGGGLWSERVQQAALEYRAAFDAMPWNADYAVRSARAWIVGRMGLPNIREMLDLAIAADPRAIQSRLDRARLELQVPEGDVGLALDQLRAVSRINPTDVGLRLEFAETLARAGRTEEARGEIRRALDYDDKLDPAEPKRMSAEKRRDAERRIESLATAPAAKP